MNTDPQHQWLSEYLSGLITPTEAAVLKRMTLNTFKYRTKQEGAPQPVIVGSGHVFYRLCEVKAWKPKTQPKTRRK